MRETSRLTYSTSVVATHCASKLFILPFVEKCLLTLETPTLFWWSVDFSNNFPSNHGLALAETPVPPRRHISRAHTPVSLPLSHQEAPADACRCAFDVLVWWCDLPVLGRIQTHTPARDVVRPGSPRRASGSRKQRPLQWRRRREEGVVVGGRAC